MGMENGDQGKLGYFCPHDSRGGGEITPNNPPYLRHCFFLKQKKDRRHFKNSRTS